MRPTSLCMSASPTRTPFSRPSSLGRRCAPASNVSWPMSKNSARGTRIGIFWRVTLGRRGMRSPHHHASAPAPGERHPGEDRPARRRCRRQRDLGAAWVRLAASIPSPNASLSASASGSSPNSALRPCGFARPIRASRHMCGGAADAGSDRGHAPGDVSTDQPQRGEGKSIVGRPKAEARTGWRRAAGARSAEGVGTGGVVTPPHPAGIPATFSPKGRREEHSSKPEARSPKPEASGLSPPG